MLAQHPEILEEVYEEIQSVVGPSRDPDLEDYSKLVKTLSAFYEALRMFRTCFTSLKGGAKSNNINH